MEDLLTEDFLRSAEASADVRIDRSTVVRLDRRPPAASDTSGAASSSVLLTFSVGRSCVQVRVEAALEHPFFVFGRGWASCAPELSRARYQLTCRPLEVGDVCISLTHKLMPPPPPPPTLGNIMEAAGSPSSPGLNYREFASPPHHHNTQFSTVASSPSPMPHREALSPSLNRSLLAPFKQVAFQDVPSVYCINTDSPPNERSPAAAACASPLPSMAASAGGRRTAAASPSLFSQSKSAGTVSPQLSFSPTQTLSLTAGGTINPTTAGEKTTATQAAYDHSGAAVSLACVAATEGGGGQQLEAVIDDAAASEVPLLQQRRTSKIKVEDQTHKPKTTF